MAASEGAWKRFYVALATCSVLGIFMVGTSWGGYGAGLGSAVTGLTIVIIASFSCCCDRYACLDNTNLRGCCCCFGCDDCRDLKLIFHMRTAMIFLGIAASIFALPVFITGIASFTAMPRSCGGRCREVREPELCAQCWEPSTWTAHPWRRWEYGLSEMCWASHINGEQRWFLAKHGVDWECHPYSDHLDDADFAINHPKDALECKALCDCLHGEWHDLCVPWLMFGVINFTNVLCAIGAVVALACGCSAASRIIRESGGPVVLNHSVGMAPAVQIGQVVGQPVGEPVQVAAQLAHPEQNPKV